MTDVASLRSTAIHATKLEEILTDVEAILDSIMAGGMLDILPADEAAANLHNSAVCLLNLAARRIAEVEAMPGTNLSIRLHVMADALHRRQQAA